MNQVPTQQIKRYKKIIVFYKSQLETMQASLSVAQREFARCQQAESKHKTRLNDVLEQFANSMIEIQHRPLGVPVLAQLKLNLQNSETQTQAAEQHLKSEMEQVMQQRTKIKSIERLLERRDAHLRSEESKNEMSQADERFLSQPSQRS